MDMAAYVASRLCHSPWFLLPKQKCKRARVADRDVVTFDTFWESFGTYVYGYILITTTLAFIVD